MAEYIANAAQIVPSGGNVLFTEDIIPCNKGYVYHRPGSGILSLKGAVNNPTSCFARYEVMFGANIAIPTGGTVEEISVALAINGEAIPTSQAIITPAAVEDLWNVTVFGFITVPRGCCETIAIENTSTQPITVQNANLVVNRVA